jgi:hypothetical protein
MIIRTRDGQKLSSYRLASATGARDGDKLTSEVIFTAGGSRLTMQMRFLVGVPTRLESGTYHWNQDSVVTQGSVTARSVMFLGGQNGPPSLGGQFNLVANDVTLYEVTLPASTLSKREPATTAPPFKSQ